MPALKGSTPWNKGKKLEKLSEEHKKKISKGLKKHGPNSGAFKKGHSPTIGFMGRKHTEETKKKMSKTRKGLLVGERNPRWKGNEVGYSAGHWRISQRWGKPNYCESCGKTEGKFHWANRSGNYNYNDQNDWLRLCVSCHNLYDGSGKMEALLYK